jgi:hypothetical protein
MFEWGICPGGGTMTEIYVVYCPDCHAEIARFMLKGSAEYAVHKHHHEEGHEPGIIPGHYPLWEVEDD